MEVGLGRCLTRLDEGGRLFDCVGFLSSLTGRELVQWLWVCCIGPLTLSLILPHIYFSHRLSVLLFSCYLHCLHCHSLVTGETATLWTKMTTLWTKIELLEHDEPTMCPFLASLTLTALEADCRSAVVLQPVGGDTTTHLLTTGDHLLNGAQDGWLWWFTGRSWVHKEFQILYSSVPSL